MYSATVDRENTALMADGPANARRPRRIAKAHVKKTVFTGVFVYPFMRYNHPEKGTKKQEYDLQSSDYFWLRNAPRPFPDVAEDIDVELKKYEEDQSEVTKKTGASSVDDLQSGTGAIAAHLKGALALLPELKERKATLSMHMNILKSLVKGIEGMT